MGPMGLMNARNIAKAKALLQNNRHKVGDLVGKATDQVDKVTKGKSSSITSKIDQAARKFSSGATAPTSTGPTGTGTTGTGTTGTGTTGTGTTEAGHTGA